MIQAALPSLLQRRGVRQFVKFCMIGFTSMIIDVGLFNLLVKLADWHWMAAQVVSFLLAVTNGFIWNSLWTFRGLGSGKRHEQYAKFVAVNIVGLALNFLIMKTMLFFMTGDIYHRENPSLVHLNVAKLVAVVFVAVWNFLANKYWTFHHKPEKPQESASSRQ